MKRVTIGKMQNPVRGFLHGSAALATVVGIVLMLDRAGGRAAAITAALVFGMALLVMYVVSTLYHTIPWSTVWKARWQRLDHSMIFLVVAGTITPIAVAVLDGAALVVSLGVIWVIAVTGILLKALLPHVRTWLSVTIQLAMGWSALVWLPVINRELGTGAVLLIAIGGLFYTLGVVVFLTKRPKLFPRAFSYHELFHLLVIAGSAAHFGVVFGYAIPAVA